MLVSLVQSKIIMKTNVLTLSKTFPKWHPRAGEPTYFKEKIYNAGVLMSGPVDYKLPANSKDPNVIKLHTLRGNYNRWNKIFEQIYAGEACLSLRVWSGKPYRSKQIEIARLTEIDGIGLQRLQFLPGPEGTMSDFRLSIDWRLRNHDEALELAHAIAKNDGLSFADWKDWMFGNGQDFRTPLAIIHFTNFRY